MKKIALEEHFSTDDLLPYVLANNKPTKNGTMFDGLRARLLDFDRARLDAMDEAGIELAVLSPTVPGVQGEPDTRAAVALARKTNDLLAAQVARRPDRYAGFASLPLQDPIAAAAEFERAVSALGFRGAMVNGHTFGQYLDDVRFDPVWEVAARLDVPIYLHPTNPVDSPAMFNGRPELNGATWAWTAEGATHALRILFGGVFQRHPGAKLILGHMGETLPYLSWRLDSRAELQRGGPLPDELRPSLLLRKHLFVTTSGACDHAALQAAIANLGADHILFSLDYPYESGPVADEFLRTAPVSEEVRRGIASGHAAKLLGLKDIVSPE